ncbi:preprotein translocase subunit SecG [Elusimicrobium posterum]|uniref:hypothetical protein n=1 Tax=Elusimicrobium posterum TaxID=3116653 RepID=UPI003C732DC0
MKSFLRGLLILLSIPVAVALILFLHRVFIIDGHFPQIAILFENETLFTAVVFFILMFLMVFVFKNDDKKAEEEAKNTALDDSFNKLLLSAKNKLLGNGVAPARNFKIKVQRQITKTTYILTILFFIVAVPLAVLAVYSSFADGLSLRFRLLGYLLAIFAIISILIPAMREQAKNKEKYVSDIIVKDGIFSLVYKQGIKTVGIQNIPLSEVNSITTTIFFELRETGATLRDMYKVHTITKIELRDGNSIEFKETLSLVTGNNFGYLFRMLKHKESLPGFSYKTQGANEASELYIKHYEENKMRRFYVKPVGMSTRELIFILIPLAMVAIPFAIIIFLEIKK